MIENINLSEFELVSNYVLVKLSMDYDFVEIPGPNGTKVELQILDRSTSTPTGNLSISGTILKTPERLLFHTDIKTHQKGETIASDEFEAKMRQTMPHDVPLMVERGDKVIFDYKSQLTAENDGRLLKDEKEGYCLLICYHNLFAKVVDNVLVPLNGWVLFIRDQKPYEYQTESGLWVVEKQNKYGVPRGTVVCADEPVKMYIQNGNSDGRVKMESGQRILIDNRYGYRIAYDLHAGKEHLENIEAISYRHILCLLNEEAKTPEDYFVLI